jgi:hypothetical protein
VVWTCGCRWAREVGNGFIEISYYYYYYCFRRYTNNINDVHVIYHLLKVYQNLTKESTYCTKENQNKGVGLDDGSVEFIID